MKKSWYLIDDATTARGQMFDQQLNAATQEEAIAAAMQEWSRLTPSEQARRDQFFVGLAAADQDGIVDLDTMTDIHYIKQ